MAFFKQLIMSLFRKAPQAASSASEPVRPILEVIRPMRKIPGEPAAVDTTNPKQFLNELKSIKPAGEMVDKARADMVKELKNLAPRRRPKI